MSVINKEYECDTEFPEIKSIASPTQEYKSRKVKGLDKITGKKVTMEYHKIKCYD